MNNLEVSQRQRDKSSVIGRTFEMTGNSSSRASSSADHKATLEDSVLGDDGEAKRFRRMRRTLETLRNNLFQIEATIIQHCKPRAQGKGMPEREKNVLKKQSQMNEKMIQQLREDLEILITSAHEARTAQAAAAAELSQLKITMAQHIAEAVSLLQAETAKQKQLFEEKISNMEKELVHMEWLRQQVKLLEEQRQESTSKFRGFTSIRTRATAVVSKDEYYDLIQENEILKFQLQALREEKGELEHINADKRQKATNISRNVEESSSDKDDSFQGPNGNDNRKDGETPGERKNGEPDLRISGRRHNALVSDRRFLEMDWSREYESLGSNRLRCKRCSTCYRRSWEMKDHVWYKHYGRKFICPYCIDSRKTFAWRGYLRKHIRDKHQRLLKK